MSIEIQLPDQDTGYDFHALFSGVITPENVRAFYGDISHHFDTWDGKRVLIEFASGAQLNGFNFSEIAALGRLTSDYQQQLGTSATAIVAPGAAIYGIARMYKAVRRPSYLLNIFRSREAAAQWLSAL